MRAYLALLRPANVATALADVLAGYGVAGLGNPRALPWLLGATACLYAGGVVLNDFFDREIDRRERPERPIPSDRVPAANAAALGGVLLVAGVLLACPATTAAGWTALTIALLVLFYDAWGKRYFAIAPLNMGLCRASNLLLGMAAVPSALETSWALGFIPLSYIWAVTALSRGEVHGGDRRVATAALLFLCGAIGALVVLTLRSGNPSFPGLALAAALMWRVLPPFWRARQDPTPATIRTAVGRGVLSLVLVDAAIGAAYAGGPYAAIILAVGLVAGLLARMFAVT
ncbi:UbiA family prenyltransferase [soil metagenome]